MDSINIEKMKSIVSVLQAKQLIQKYGLGKVLKLIDVRDLSQHILENIAGSQCIPLNQLQQNISKFDKNHQYIIYCKSGMRTLTAANFFNENGLKSTLIKGGIQAWKKQKLPVEGCIQQINVLTKKQNQKILEEDKKKFVSKKIINKKIYCKQLEAIIKEEKLLNRIIILDVRSGLQFNQDHIPYSISMPLCELNDSNQNFLGDKIYIVYCQNGGRSSLALGLLQNKGLKCCCSLQGGYNQWLKESNLVIG